jgi:hypothetical protein
LCFLGTTVLETGVRALSLLITLIYIYIDNRCLAPPPPP